MASTLNSLRDECYRLLGETNSTGNTRLPQGMVLTALNRAAEEFARKTGCIWNSKLQNMTSGTANYTITMNASVRPYQVKQVMVALQAGDTSRTPIDRYDSRAMGRLQPNWKKLPTGVPKWFFVAAGAVANTTFQVTLIPAPNYTTTSGEGIEIEYYRLPTAMVGTSTKLDVPDRWEGAILARALMDLGASLSLPIGIWEATYREAIADAMQERMWEEAMGVHFGGKYGLGAMDDGGYGDY